MDAPGSLIRFYQALWRNVLALAVSDALGFSAYNHPAPKHEREATRDWLLSNNGDFKLVCHLAGLDPDYVHGKMVDLFGLPYPELSTWVESVSARPGRPRRRAIRQSWHRDRPSHRYDPLNRPV